MNPNYINEPDSLVWATHYAAEEQFLHCLNRGDDVNVRDEYGRTPLHAAAEEGWVYYASILIERGADILLTDQEGDTPLDYAVFHEHHELASLLRSHGAIDCDGKSARQRLEDEAYEGFTSANAVKQLVAVIEEQQAHSIVSSDDGVPAEEADQQQHVKPPAKL